MSFCRFSFVSNDTSRRLGFHVLLSSSQFGRDHLWKITFVTVYYKIVTDDKDLGTIP